MKPTFDLTTLPIGTEVWSPIFGQGIITSVKDDDGIFPVEVWDNAKTGRFSYNYFSKEGYTSISCHSSYPMLAPSEAAWLANPTDPWADYSLEDKQTAATTPQPTMNKDLNLVEILRNTPRGTKLYSPIFGDVVLGHIDIDDSYPICIITKNSNGEENEESFASSGEFYLHLPDSECLLFPSKDQRDWSKFEIEKVKYQPKDKELVWAWDSDFTHRRCLGFYDAKHKSIFFKNGHRGHGCYDFYAPYEGEYPEWAKEAQKTLED